MGVFYNFVNRAQRPNASIEIDHSNDRRVTPADLMTYSRVPLALLSARRLYKGKRGALGFAIAMAASDAEGNVARYIDKKFPDSGYGTTNHGKLMDPIADTASLLTLCGGALISPGLNRISKLAVGVVLGQEFVKAVWATSQNSKYKQATGEKLVLPVSPAGKEAMAEKFAAITLAVASNEIDGSRGQRILGAAALGFAVMGARRGESARGEYLAMINDPSIAHREPHNLSLDGEPA